jgi:hypothetical protein
MASDPSRPGNEDGPPGERCCSLPAARASTPRLSPRLYPLPPAPAPTRYPPVSQRAGAKPAIAITGAPSAPGAKPTRCPKTAPGPSATR